MRLCYWIKSTVRNTALIIGIVFLMSFYLFYSVDEAGVDFWERSGTFIATLSPLCAMLFAISAHKVEIPLAIAFSATRREAFVGLQLFRAIPTAVCIVLGCVLMACSDSIDSERLLVSFVPLALSIALLYHVFGAIVSMAIGRFGKAAGTLTALAVGVVSGISVFGFMVVDTALALAGVKLLSLLIFSVIAYAAVLPFEWRAIKHLTVKL